MTRQAANWMVVGDLRGQKAAAPLKHFASKILKGNGMNLRGQKAAAPLKQLWKSALLGFLAIISAAKKPRPR